MSGLQFRFGAFTLLCLAMTAGAFSSYAAGQTASALKCGNADIGGFIPAHIESNPSPRYPKNALIDGNEGWVVLEYTVSPNGSVHNPVVMDAMGPPELIEESIRVIPKWKFKPASRNGVAVDEHRKQTEFIYRYESGTMSPTNQHDFIVVYVHPAADRTQASTHDEFSRLFKQGNDHLERKNYPEAAQSFEALLRARLNLYERARASLALATLYSEAGDHPRAYHYIVHATIRNAENLEQRRRGEALTLRMKLAIQAGALAEAGCTFEKLGSIDPAAVAPESGAAKMMAAINALVASPAPLEIPAKLAAIPHLGQPAGWQHRLLRSNFSFAQLQGDVKSFRLACTGTVLEAAVDQEQQWNVPPGAGTCMLRVAGAQGATFRLVEEE